MYAVWVSLKQNMNCSARSADAFKPEKLDIRNHSFRKVNPARELHAVKEHPSYDVIFGQNLKRERFSELDKGDTSRNIVEMIFRSALMNPEKQNKKIERVLKVMNSPEMLQRFEEYRETVKKRARGLCRRNPRSMVDGNELLMFYATSMSCCCSRKAQKILALCENHICGACRIIQSGFETEETKTNGIQMSAVSDASDDEMASVVKGKKVKRAVVLCRVIAGRVAGMVGGGEEGFDSVRSGQLVHLFLRNPSAVLPCFVIVCS
ncbi:hypothetical protein AAC387_Pa05g1573 [Persea americana]